MSKGTLPTTVLTLLAVAASTVAIAGCGGKSSSGSSTGVTTTGTHKPPSKAPGY